MTNCPNCGAVVDPDADRCAYCGTPYPTRRVLVTSNVLDYVEKCMKSGTMTTNEARQFLGLPKV